MGKYRRLGKNTLLVFIGNAGAKLISLLMLPFYTRWLSVEDYGSTDIITVYVTFLTGFVSCNIAESIFIFPKGADRDRQEIYFSSASFFLFLMLGLTALIFGVASVVFKRCDIHNSFSDNLWLIYGMLAGMIVQQFAQQFTRSIDKIQVYSITGIVLTGFTALFAFMLIPKWGVDGYVWSMIGAYLLSALYSITFSRGYTYWSCHRFSINACKEMLKYSIPLIPNGIMWWLVSALNRPLMEAHLGMYAIGIFAVANKFPGILSMLFTVFVTSWQISVLEEFGKKGYEVFFNRVFRSVVTGLLIVSLLITLCSKLLVSLFTSDDFFEAWQYIPLLVLGTVFSCVSSMAGSNFSATRTSKYFFYSSVWGAVAAVLFNFILIPSLAIWGVALSVMLSFVVMALSRIWYGWKYVQITNVWKYIWMLVLTGLYIVAASLQVTPYWFNLIGFVSVVGIFAFINKDLLLLVQTKFKLRK
ncbi:polysaccharide biosynthesis protein [Phocaeicola salanitronis DSM 18170]|uniref:Polysaccharide biosynthesis protein n=1 Tax=Phocaeicola salanitronis (strain DSM 18170 / JCM 13657 / CCUG 60908 / BL78) TaxID=667015 RepID=F0R4J5_PHOSB|nr:oligosaccharide flippase family protein [Phocaeicola salanitronis]ADY34685.1 polysaccharide biosynthesis protein [Phocaeicola salanitronis DSM 18170]